MRGWQVTLAIFLLFAMIGCSSSPDSSGGGNAGSDGGGKGNRQQAVIAPKKMEVADLSTGISMLSTLTKDFKQAVEADDEGQRKELVAQIAGVWEEIKADLEAQSGDTYPAVAQEMTAFLDSASGEAIDRELVIQQDYQLYQRFRDLGKALKE